MIHNINPHEFCNDYKNKTIKENDFVLIYNGSSVLLGEEDGEILIPMLRDFVDIYTDIKSQAQFLFLIDGMEYYLIKDVVVAENDKYTYVNTIEYRYKLPMWSAFACAVGEQLNRWYVENKFCSKCGKIVTPHDKERALTCTNCGRVTYPTISPAVIVAVLDGDRILLTKNSRGNYKKYALVAGYTEVGESIEETVKREVLEEVGLHIKNIRYYKSQPWPFSNTLLMGFFAELDGLDNIVLQEEELTEAVWFKRDEIPPNESKISLTNEMIELFRNSKE